MSSPEQLPFKEAIDFFKQKIKLPTSGWTDIWQQQHSLAFVVAGAQTDALVNDFYNAMLKAKEQGTGYATFQDDFNRIVSNHKWAYNGTPGWRSKVIYDTNMTAAYSAGSWQQQWASRHEMPYLQYVHTSREHPRLEHKSWNGKILPITSPWWDTHYAPNGWGCKCRVDPLTRSQAEREWTVAGKTGPDAEPQVVWEDRIVGKTTSPKVVRTPVGIDPGFAYNPGKAYLEPHTVPPLDGYERVFNKRKVPLPAGVERPAVLAPTKLPASAILPPTNSPTERVNEYLGLFGASIDKGAVFIDVTETPLVISKALFIKGGDKTTDQFKWLDDPKKTDRLDNINLLAMTLIEPDEVWWVWVRDFTSNGKQDGGWRLRRRYLKSFEIDGIKKYGMAVFEWGANGWIGATTFTPEDGTETRESYFDKQRMGRLVYQRKK